MENSAAQPTHVSTVQTKRQITVLGVDIADLTRSAALEDLESRILARQRCHSVYFVNAHTLNVAASQPDYRDVLNSGDLLLNDGTGVRWAARQRKIELYDNLNGTDFIPDFLQAFGGRGYRYFMLGAEPDVIESAAAAARERFPGWTQAGFHHGYVNGEPSRRIVEQINDANADVLLVAMGNPLQENWIHRHQAELKVSLAFGVGGLFDFWVNRPPRAPLWIRRAGCEWMHRLVKQPAKARRYVLGNPLFLYRITRALKEDLATMSASHDRGGLDGPHNSMDESASMATMESETEMPANCK